MSTIDELKGIWRNAGTFCRLCGQPGMKQIRDAECRPHDCPHGKLCVPTHGSPELSYTSCCPECNSRERLIDVLREAKRGKLEGD